MCPVGLALVVLSTPGPVGCVDVGDRRHASERSIPPGPPVALLASLGYLSADGDGVDQPELEQNNSRLQAPLNQNAYAHMKQSVCCTGGELSSFRLLVKHRCTKSASLHFREGALLFIKPHHTHTRTHTHADTHTLPPLCHTHMHSHTGRSSAAVHTNS